MEKQLKKIIKFDKNSFNIEFATITVFMILLGLASITTFRDGEWNVDWNDFWYSILSEENNIAFLIVLLFFLIAYIIWFNIVKRKLYQINIEKRLKENRKAIRAQVIDVTPQYYPYGYSGSRRYTIMASYVEKEKTYLFTGKFVEPDIFFVLIFEEIKRIGKVPPDITIQVEPNDFKIYKMQIYEWLVELMKRNESLFSGNPFEAIKKSQEQEKLH